ncbi:MAG: hypothetical protein QM770_19585 [Tepidisphaeraceae bacterium]
MCVAWLAGLAALVVGCDERSDVRVYEVDAPQAARSPSTATAPAGPGGQASSEAGTADGAAGLRWKLPAGWERLPDTSQMRVATFRATKGEPLEIALSRFPGNTGGLLANVNRWRQQVGLPAIAEDTLSAELHAIETNSLQGHTMRLRGPSQHMLGAILTPKDASETWFVKAVGAPAAVDAHEAEFGEFVASMQVPPSEAKP